MFLLERKEEIGDVMDIERNIKVIGENELN